MGLLQNRENDWPQSFFLKINEKGKKPQRGVRLLKEKAGRERPAFVLVRWK